MLLVTLLVNLGPKMNKISNNMTGVNNFKILRLPFYSE